MPQRSRTMPGMKSRSSILNMDMHLSTTTLVQNEEPVPLLPTPPASPPLPQLPQSQSTFSKAAKWFTVGRSSTIHVPEGANEKMKEKDRLRAQVEELQAKVKTLEPQVGELQDYLALERQKSASLGKRNKVLENETGLMKDALEKVALENASLSCDLRDVLKAQLSIEGKALISSFEQNQQIEEMALTISTLGVALKRTQEENERLTRQNLTLTETISRLEDEWSSLDEQLSEKEQVLKQALKANEAHLQRARMSNATLKSALESAEVQNRSFQYTNAALEDSNRSLSKECASMRRRLQEKEEEVKQKEKDYSTQLRNLKNRVQGLKTEVQFLNQKSTADREARAEADRNVADLAEKYDLCSRLLKESDLHVENLKASLEEANTREVALKDNLGNLEDKIDFVWAEMKKEASRSHNVDSEKRHLEQVMAGKESLWSQKEQQYKDMIENVKSEQRRKVTELQSDLARYRSSASSIEKAVREHRDHNDILKPHVDALRRMIWPPTTPARLALEDWYRRAA